MVKLFKILNVNETFCAKTDTDFLKLLFSFSIHYLISF